MLSDSGRRTAAYAAQKLAIDRRQLFPQFAGCCFIPCANVNANNLTLCLHQAPTAPTACCLCFLPMTITHRIETLAPPLFLGVTCTLRASLAYFSLTSRKQPLFRNLCCTSDSGQRNAFHDRSVPVWRKSIAFLVGCSMNGRPQSRHFNLCLPLWMRPFLTVWEDAQMGQVGMGGEQPETLLLHGYIFNTTNPHRRRHR